LRQIVQSVNKIVERVGMGKSAVQKCKKRSSAKISNGQHFFPSERKKRKDSVKEPAEAAVNVCYHSNEEALVAFCAEARYSKFGRQISPYIYRFFRDDGFEGSGD
jgi:hypothetical protein